MGRYDWGSDEQLAQAMVVDAFGPEDVDLLEYLARQSPADDGRRVCRRRR